MPFFFHIVIALILLVVVMVVGVNTTFNDELDELDRMLFNILAVLLAVSFGVELRFIYVTVSGVF